MKVSVSTNPPPIDKLFDYIGYLNALNIDSIHCDVMDGVFVPAKTFDYKIIKQIRKITSLPLDVHLMISNFKTIKKYIKSGADCVTIHFEALKDIAQGQSLLLKINKLGVKSGIAINPKTQVDNIVPLLTYINQIVVMTVEPGKSGQKMIVDCLDKIKQIKKHLKSFGINDVSIMVDGGVNDKNIGLVKSAKADIVAVGNYLYKSNNRYKALEKLTKI